MADEAKLKIVIAKKDGIFARINQLYTSAKKIIPSNIDTRSKQEFLAASSNIDKLYKNFNDLCDEHNVLLLQQNPNYVLDFNNWNSFETLFAFVQYTRTVLLESRVNLDKPETFSGNYCRLAPLELVGFNGQPESWPLFYQCFKTNVHDNKQLTDGQRVQYLVGKLSGNALNVFAGIIPNETNYSTIWNSLVTKYQDKRLLGSMYLNNILDIKPASDSAAHLNNFIERIHSSWAALKDLGIKDLADFIVTHLALKKLDSQLVQHFELSIRDKDIPDSEELITFIRHRIKCLERTTSSRQSSTFQTARNSQGSYSQAASKKISNTFTITQGINNKSECIFCKKPYHIHLYECVEFKKLDVKDRFKFIKDNKLCINCFSGKHIVFNCASLNTCKQCKKKHHSLLHFDIPIRSQHSNVGVENRPQAPAVNRKGNTASVDAFISAQTSQSSSMQNASSLALVGSSNITDTSTKINNDTLALHSCHDDSFSSRQVIKQTVLPTAQVYIFNNKSRFTIRCLVDSGSQNNLITGACCQKLKLNIQPIINSSIKSIGSLSAPIRGYVTLTIHSRVSKAQYNLTLLVVDHITDQLPLHEIQKPAMEYLTHLPLADENWNLPGDIDAILGTQMFALILLGHKVNIASPYQRGDVSTSLSLPQALETTLGYIVMGDISNINSERTVLSFGPIVDKLDKSIERFWEIEEVPNLKLLSSEDQGCENFYKTSIKRSSCGRYIVSLPFKDDPKTLGDSFVSARRRLSALERKFKALPELREAYNDVIRDYIKNGYLSEIPYSITTINEGYFIPHHAVVRPDKSTTKTRIVLDASCKTDTGVSLNDILHNGPNLQADLFSLLLNFRYFKIAITADIRQMYLRILLTEKDRKYQKILYRFNDCEPIRIFQYNTVAFGIKSSPFLAMRTIRQLTEDYQDQFPLAAAVATRELYMDDLTTSVNCITDGLRLTNELLDLFKLGGFDLVKWASNSPELLAHLHESSIAPIEFTDDSSTLKILGLKWLPAADVFTFSASATPSSTSKRAILSTISRLFDVLGLVAPVILYAKLLVQELWLAKIDWDDEPPANIIERFSKLTSELSLLTNLRIPRHLGVASGCVVNLLAFGDASMKAYGCVVYLHVTNSNGDISVHLVGSKSKVAPLKTVSLARLELSAALLLAKLVKRVHTVFQHRHPIKEIYAFSDSTITLSWIHSSPHRWQTFVANRVAQIHDNLSPNRFFHINGMENPSDCLSRGLLPSQILNHELWWNGPNWAHRSIDEWPIVPFNPSYTAESIPEIKTSCTFTALSNKDNSLLLDLACRISSWKKLLRVTVYILRFIRKLPRSPLIQVSDLDAAELVIVKELQSEYFYNEINNIKQGKLPSPYLRKLNLFLDNNGLLRVGGRLTNANIPYENRHPLLLPRRHHIINLIITDCHRSNCHTGSHLLMSLLRQRYWILSARNIIRQQIRQCNYCFKVAPSHPTPMMASLPPARVQEAKAFTHTGIDYAGPINITLTRRRGVKSQKAYICLFVCFTTKAIHIELASDLSAESFLDALKRFLSRRGPVSVLYSDNGSNFIGAKRQLDELYTFLSCKDTSAALQAELNNHRISWRTIPPRAPHWGGIWESNIKCIKTHLYRCIGKQLLCYEELLTVLAQIECLLNTRPLCLLSDQPHTIITPAHFLNMTPLQSFPAYEINKNMSLYNRKKLLDSLVQSYWKKWHLDYLHTLQLRQKWNTPDKPVQPGTVVLVHQDDLPPLRWPTGIIEQVYPGRDGVARAALVRTTGGTYKRPLVKLCPLPLQ